VSKLAPGGVTPPHPDPLFHIVMYESEIPQNTGNVGRLCLALQARLHLVHPLGFQTDAKAVRRAGLDYWHQVDVVEHVDGDAFWAWAEHRSCYLFSSLSERPFTGIPFAQGDVYIFGRESVGLPQSLVDQHGAWSLPMIGNTRSLNVSNVASIVAYSALQVIRPDLFRGC
jgi:tRNA (cytidine/uridine-2'-O-)-methyltransferase